MSKPATYVFKVRIHRDDTSSEDYSVIASDDLQARETAVALDAESFRRALQGEEDDEPIAVAFCETQLVPGLINIKLHHARKPKPTLAQPARARRK